MYLSKHHQFMSKHLHLIIPATIPVAKQIKDCLPLVQQIAIVFPWIDPEYWQRKFKDYMADTEWAKDILQKAGL